jgi:hypothetical protein
LFFDFSVIPNELSLWTCSKFEFVDKIRKYVESPQISQILIDFEPDSIEMQRLFVKPHLCRKPIDERNSVEWLFNKSCKTHWI